MQTQVLISGGGVAGLTLALSLAKQHVHVIVIEKQNSPKVKYKGELLQPKSLFILERLKVISKVIAAGKKIFSTQVEEVLSNHTKNVTWDYRILESKYNYALMIPHEKFKKILLKEAEQYEHFTYLNPAKFMAFTDEVDPLKQKAIIMIDKNEIKIKANIYVGAEGRVSPIRKLSKIGLRENQYNHQFLTVSFPSPPEIKGGKIISKGSRFLGMFPLPDQKVRTVIFIKPGEFKELKKGGLNYFHELYYKLFPPMEGFVNQIKSWKEIQLMIPHRHNAKSYVHNNRVIIGDAAHSVHPMAGEGMNLAIQDSDVLGELIPWVLDSGNYDDLYWYEKVRKPRVEFISKLSHHSALTYSFSHDLWRRFRMHVLNNVEHSNWLHFQNMLNISGLGMLPETFKDRITQIMGTHQLYDPDFEQAEYFFTEKDDYPWKDKIEGGWKYA